MLAPLLTEVVFCHKEPVGRAVVSVDFQRGKLVCLACVNSGAYFVPAVILKSVNSVPVPAIISHAPSPADPSGVTSESA